MHHGAAARPPSRGFGGFEEDKRIRVLRLSCSLMDQAPAALGPSGCSALVASFLSGAWRPLNADPPLVSSCKASWAPLGLVLCQVEPREARVLGVGFFSTFPPFLSHVEPLGPC